MTSLRQFMKERLKEGSGVNSFRRGPSHFSHDFMYDAIRDVDLPRTRKFEVLLAYMRSQQSCPEAIEGLLDTWADWTLYRIDQDEL